MKKIIAIVGARPQFIKHFPIDKASKGKINLVTIHTGQHYDEEMSQIFFDELQMSRPDYALHVGSSNHGEQTGKMLTEIEKIFEKEKPDGIIVYGDTNSTLAGALAGAKLHLPIAHIEAGIRSYNKKLPEEVNRLLTDHLSSLFFIPTPNARLDLKKEGITENVFECGDIMKEVLDYVLDNNLLVNKEVVSRKEFYYATIHRPYNTDEKEVLKTLLTTFDNLDKKVVFAIHPRTESKMSAYNLETDSYENIAFIKPQSYINNLSYINSCNCVITDSGGIQKEAYWLKKKCITLRSETEWVETLENSWNILSSNEFGSIKNALEKAVGDYKPLYSIERTSEKIIEKIIENF